MSVGLINTNDRDHAEALREIHRTESFGTLEQLTGQYCKEWLEQYQGDAAKAIELMGHGELGVVDDFLKWLVEDSRLHLIVLTTTEARAGVPDWLIGELVANYKVQSIDKASLAAVYYDAVNPNHAKIRLKNGERRPIHPIPNGAPPEVFRCIKQEVAVDILDDSWGLANVRDIVAAVQEQKHFTATDVTSDGGNVSMTIYKEAVDGAPKRHWGRLIKYIIGHENMIGGGMVEVQCEDHYTIHSAESPFNPTPADVMIHGVRLTWTHDHNGVEGFGTYQVKEVIEKINEGFYYEL